MRRRAKPTAEQLPLALPRSRATQRRSAKPCSRERANWWFAQMRRVVEQELDFEAPGVF